MSLTLNSGNMAKLQGIWQCCCSDSDRQTYAVPTNMLDTQHDYRHLWLLKWQMELLFREHGIEIVSAFDYNYNNMIFCKESDSMNAAYSYTLNIPYENRSAYLTSVQKLCKLVPGTGLVGFFVSNDPYQLEAYLVIELEQEQQEIENVIKLSSLALTEKKGFIEFIRELVYRKWNYVIFPLYDIKQTEKEYFSVIQELYLSQFWFAEKNDLEVLGYHPEKNVERKHLFISYCHKDKDTVTHIIHEMKRHGIYFWWDEQEIDAGDVIVSKVHEGIRDSDLVILFISKSTINALFAKHEMETVLQELIYGRKSWFIVNLDGVDPEDIMNGLSGFKYYNYYVNQNIHELLEAIDRKIERLS